MSDIFLVNDENLSKNIESLIDVHEKQLKGEYSFYCIYEKGNSKYALIHAFYNEENNIKEEDMPKIISSDGRFMQQKLIESKLAVDYFFVMPYFDFKDKSKGSVLLNNCVLETNKI